MKKKKIKILYIIDGLFPGGKERQFIEILKGLDREEFTIGIVTFNRDLFYSKQAKELSDYFVELDKRKNKFKPFITIWKCFTHFKPDLVHTWDYLSSLYSYFPAKFSGSKFINGSIRDSGTEKGWQNLVKKIMLRISDLVIANSLAGLKNYGVNKGEVIYNAVDLNRFLPKHQNEEFNVIMVANFSDYKDHNTFTLAAIQLVKNGIVDKVYYAGDGKFRSKYEQMVGNEMPGETNQFVFLGAIANVEEILQNCEVGVLCSTLKYSEGISNSVLEYMAASLVPVVTNIGGSSEIINNTLNGFLINAESVDEIISKVKLVKSDKEIRDKIIFEARKTIEEKFNYKNNLIKLVDIYKRLIHYS
ncbi:MAG: glycosyltransferase [Bacteroidales bacterium]